MDHEIWKKAVSDRSDVIVCAFGGLFESLMSLSFIEALKINNTSFGVGWVGFNGYRSLSRAQGLSYQCNVDIGKDDVEKYPVPLFFDAENRAYMNALNNYIETVSWNQMHRFKNKGPLAEQLFANSLVNWTKEYSPKLRRISEMKNYREWRRTYRFDRNRFVLVILDSCFSKHDVDCLGWDVRQVRSLAAMMHQFDLPVVVATHNPGRLHGTNVVTAPMDLEVLINLVSKSTVVLSQDWDWLMAAMMISKAAIVGKHTEGPFDLYRNAEFLQSENVILTDVSVPRPIEVFRFCEGL